MTEKEVEQLKERVRRVAAEQVHKMVQEEQYALQKASHEQEKEFAVEVEAIRGALSRYRFEPEGSRIRECVDWLIRRHAKLKHAMAFDNTYSIRHNAIVLEYIIKKPMTHNQIEKKLGISDGTFKRYIDTGIRELTDILFCGYITDIYV